MKKYLYSLLIVFGFINVAQIAQADTTILPPDPITNVRTDTNLKNNPEVKLKNLDMLNSRLYTIVDNDKQLYFCLDESKYYPSGNEYKVDLNEKISGPVLWLMETFYQNQNKTETDTVDNVPSYRDANELTRYAAVQITIWKFTGSQFNNELITSNPLVKELYDEAKTKPTNDTSYQEVIDKLKDIEINATEIKPNGDDGVNYNYKLQFEDNLDAETEKLFKINDEATNITVQLYKHGKTITITKDVTTEKNYNDRTILINIPKSLIDDDKAEDTAIYFNIDTTLTTRQPYYLVFVASGVQPIGGYQPIERILTARTSIELDTDETSFSVLKKWEDGNNQDGKRPLELPVQLYQSNQPYNYANNNVSTSGKEIKFGERKLLNEENGWEYIWANLPVTDEQGNKVYYTSKEEWNSDYELTIQDTDDGKAILLINSYKPETIDLQGLKKWNDGNNQDGKRPTAILVTLLADGEPIQKKIVTEQQEWRYQFTHLPKYKNGQEITYTVSEEEVPDYSTSIEGTTIINTHIPEQTELKGNKIWEDGNNQDGKRPDTIVINLLADGVLVASKEVSETDHWAYAFTDLPKYQNGIEIKYTVIENNVPEYSTIIDGTTITNRYTPGKTSVTATKVWNDANDQDGLRPETIQVQLYANGQEQGQPVELNDANNWTTTWSDLAEKEAGKAISYTVKEVGVFEGYEMKLDGQNQGNIFITNTHIPEQTELKGSKIWEDGNNQDGKRPDTIVINLLADGVLVASKEVSETDHWAYAFTDLPKYQNGIEIKYTVTENNVPGYSTTIDGTTITNRYTPGKTSVTATKAWNDANDQDGLRPETIQVQLYANGQEQGQPVELNDANNWTTTWSDLAEKEAGKAISYTVKEVGIIKGYEATINNQDQGNILITNTHTPIATTNSTTAKPKGHYPATGEITNTLLYVMGSLLLVIGLYASMRKVRGKNK